MNISRLFCLFVIASILGCSMIKERKINLNQLQLAKLKMETNYSEDSCVVVDILSFFPSMQRCGINKGQANLYVCKQESTGDTLYVFAQCARDRALPFFKGVNIMKRDIKHPDLKEVIVSVPEDFIIPEKARYVFSDLFWLED